MCGGEVHGQGEALEGGHNHGGDETDCGEDEEDPVAEDRGPPLTELPRHGLVCGLFAGGGDLAEPTRERRRDECGGERGGGGDPEDVGPAEEREQAAGEGRADDDDGGADTRAEADQAFSGEAALPGDGG